MVDCASLAGPITLSRFDTHLVGCHGEGAGACTSAQRDQRDLNRPLYAAGASTIQARKVATGTCAIARATLP